MSRESPEGIGALKALKFANSPAHPALAHLRRASTLSCPPTPAYFKKFPAGLLGIPIAPNYESGGQEFESLRARHKLNVLRKISVKVNLPCRMKKSAWHLHGSAQIGRNSANIGLGVSGYEGERDPSYRVVLQNEGGDFELGAAWRKTSDPGVAYLSVMLDDAVFPGRCDAALFPMPIERQRDLCGSGLSQCRLQCRVRKEEQASQLPRRAPAV